ncbi:hypothetical protein BSKO_12214 [Bryopsis sp. KO-2023]|nr:hypothetical protein BSKO_12214 [Bryopsis sp. KO-2023]
MASERLATWSCEVKDLLVFSDRLTEEASGLLQNFSARLQNYSRQTAPIRLRAKTLTAASQNIKKAREKSEDLIASLDMSRRLGGIITRGPSRGQLDSFLNAMKDLNHAIQVLDENKNLVCVKEALNHARQVFAGGMHECETDFATTLSENSRVLPAKAFLREEGAELVSPDVIPRLRVLAETMLAGEHEGFARVYVDIRSEVMEKVFQDMGLREINGLYLQGLSFEHFEKKVQEWIKIIHVLVQILRQEKQLAQDVFATHKSQAVFGQVIDRTLDLVLLFGQEIAVTRRAHEKLFSLLDMHLHMQDVVSQIKGVLEGTPCAAFVRDMQELMGEVAKVSTNIFKQYQESIGLDVMKKEISDGTVHPLCASVMTYFKRLLRHGNFLRVLFRVSGQDGAKQFKVGNPMSTSMAHILMVLQSNLESKSKGCKNSALAALFLMNNVQFMVRSVEQSKAALLLGTSWMSRHKQVVEDYCMQYFAITWEPIISSLNRHMDDLKLGSVPKRNSAIKERFKNFNRLFTEIHETQSEWAIPDADQKRSVKKRILEEALPAYASFHDAMEKISFAKTKEKYFKYTVGQMEQIINEDLFENKIGK